MRYLLSVCALCLFAVPVQSQAAPPLIGQRVWVRLSTRSGALNSGVKGRLEGFTDDSLRLRVQGEAVSVALGEQTQLFVFAGRQSSSGRGAAIGGGVGVLAGAIIGFAAGGGCSGGPGEFLCFDRGTLAAAGAVGLGGIGLIGGLIVGALISHDTWAPAGWSRTVRPVVTPSPHGVGLGLSLSF